MDGQQIFQFLSTYGYWIIFPLMLLEGPVVTIMSAILASLGAFNVWIVLLLSVVGDVLGDVGLYGIGKKWGFNFVNKFGKYIGITKKKVLRMEKYFINHGGKTVFLAKSTTGLCFVTFVAAGISNMDFKKFIKYSILGGLVWSSFLVIMGYFYGYLWREIKQYIEWVGWIITALTFITFILINIFKLQKTKKIFGNNILKTSKK